MCWIANLASFRRRSTSDSSACIPFTELQVARKQLQHRVTPKRFLVFHRPGWSGWSNVRGPFSGGKTLRCAHRGGGRKAPTPPPTTRQRCRDGSPSAKERALALEIGSGGGRNSGAMGGCHPGATFLCAFDCDVGG